MKGVLFSRIRRDVSTTVGVRVRVRVRVWVRVRVRVRFRLGSAFQSGFRPRLGVKVRVRVTCGGAEEARGRHGTGVGELVVHVVGGGGGHAV